VTLISLVVEPLQYFCEFHVSMVRLTRAGFASGEPWQNGLRCVPSSWDMRVVPGSYPDSYGRRKRATIRWLRLYRGRGRHPVR